MITSAFQYHQHTSYDPDDMSGHGLDWANQPNVYKEYPGMEPIQLPLESLPPAKKLSNVLRYDTTHKANTHLHINDASLLLRLTHTLTAKSRHAGGDFYYRSAASAGALYPTEIYAVTRSVKDLDDGLYHFSIHTHGLVPLRTGDFSNYIKDHIYSSGHEAPVVTLFLTAIFFRSAWKYRDRSYRYHLLDTGHVLENLCLAFKAMGLPHRLCFDFNDKEINHLLGLNETKEVALAVAYVPQWNDVQAMAEPEVAALSDRMLAAGIVARSETDYPAVREMHQAGEQVLMNEASIPAMSHALGLVPDTRESLPSDPVWPETIDYPDTVFQRRSRRRYSKRPMPKEHLTALLDALCVKDLQDTEDTRTYEASMAVGFIVSKVDGFFPGLYLLNRSDRSIGPVTTDPSTLQMARACLGQSWLAEASVHFLFMTNLDLLDRTWGPRGYRYAMLTTGRLGERLYVAATAMGLGCCGIGAFYDMHAAKILGLNDISRLLYLVAVGMMK